MLGGLSGGNTQGLLDEWSHVYRGVAGLLRYIDVSSKLVSVCHSFSRLATAGTCRVFF